MMMMMMMMKYNILERKFKPRNNILNSVTVQMKCLMNWQGKGKAIPLQALTGPEGSRRLRLPDFEIIGT
jgi:hypothetical protein